MNEIAYDSQATAIINKIMTNLTHENGVKFNIIDMVTFPKMERSKLRRKLRHIRPRGACFFRMQRIKYEAIANT